MDTCCLRPQTTLSPKYDPLATKQAPSCPLEVAASELLVLWHAPGHATAVRPMGRSLLSQVSTQALWCIEDPVLELSGTLIARLTNGSFTQAALQVLHSKSKPAT